jgi:predicted nucleic acid-binding protein
MISALDSSVILDVVTDDPSFADASEALLRRASAEGQLVAGECVLAEIRPAFSDSGEFETFLQDWQIEFVSSSLESAKLAGEHFRTYLERGGRQGRIVADFLIGAHASVLADRLLARDRGYLRDYFQELNLASPAEG